MKKEKQSDVPTKTYIMELGGGRLRRVTVPATWKVTFGPLVPTREGKGDQFGREMKRTFALRFYESANEQRAVFTDVLSFRDESLKIEERVTKTHQKMVHKDAPSGRREAMVEARVTQWVNPDSPDDGDTDPFLQLTAGDKEL